jgi:3-oxoacyl-[acyl-carrier protein] reductase
LGITVNSVCPGSTETELFHEAVPPEIARTLSTKSPFGRLADPRDIADVVAFVASDEARWLTGQRIVVSGGAR